MTIKHGFSLIECMIYCFLFSLLVMMIFSLAINTQIKTTKQSNIAASLIGVHAAQDLFARDIRQAYELSSSWKKINKEELVWHSNGIDIGWEFVQGKLFRIEGAYNMQAQKWTQKIKSLIADKLKQVTFERQIKTL